jgi:hypothetical protein
MKWVRILAGLGIFVAVLAVAAKAVRDCEIGLLLYENCFWLDVRDAFGLPPSKLLRALVLQAVGVSLLGAIYFAWKYVLPTRARKAGSRDGG